MRKILRIAFAAVMIMSLVACNKDKSNHDSESNTTITTEQLFMINGKLYYGTDEVGPMGDAGSVEGNIVSSVESNEIPSQDAESNFGCIGNPYTFDDGDGWIMILMDDEEYHVFYEKDIPE